MTKHMYCRVCLKKVENLLTRIEHIKFVDGQFYDLSVGDQTLTQTQNRLVGNYKQKYNICKSYLKIKDENVH